MSPNPDKARGLTRRTLLGSALGLAFAPSIGFAKADEDEIEIARVMKIADTAGIKDFGVSKNERYLAIGNAPKEFRTTCLSMLLGLERDYMEHFQFKGFAPKKLSGRMTVIMLDDRRSFARYLGKDDQLVGGTYDPVANDLLMFDNREAKVDFAKAKLNTMVLTHEAVHQLTFNTGLLRREGDVPKFIAEGLANYAEVRSPDGKKSRFGGINPRIYGYREASGQKSPTLPPIEILIHDDSRIDAAATEVDAYCEAWFLVHFLMTNKKMLPKFRNYLEAIKKRDDASHRMEDWRERFGDDATFNREFTKYVREIKLPK